MNLNLFENLKKDIESNVNVKKFMEELTDFLNNMSSTKKKENNIDNKNSLEQNDKKLDGYRKEGHLYLVTEDRDNKVYLWDFTDKPKNEIEEMNLPEELLSIAKEGTMLQYKNGKYKLYSEDGYDMLFNEKNEEK